MTKIDDERRAELAKLQAELVEARRSHATRELANTNRLKELRRQIARLKTSLSSQKYHKENA